MEQTNDSVIFDDIASIPSPDYKYKPKYVPQTSKTILVNNDVNEFENIKNISKLIETDDNDSDDDTDNYPTKCKYDEGSLCDSPLEDYQSENSKPSTPETPETPESKSWFFKWSV